MAKDLRGFLSEIEAEEPDQVLRVKKEVDPHFEVTGVLAKLEQERKFPVVIFEKVKGSALPVVTNVHADARRLFGRSAQDGTLPNLSASTPPRGLSQAARRCQRSARARGGPDGKT